MSPAPVASTACTEDTNLRWGREEKPKKALVQDYGQHKARLSNLPFQGRGALQSGHGAAMPRARAAGGRRTLPVLPAQARGAPRGASPILPFAPFPPAAPRRSAAEGSAPAECDTLCRPSGSRLPSIRAASGAAPRC